MQYLCIVLKRTFERTLVRATESLSGLQAGVDTSEVSEERADLLLATFLVLLGSVGENGKQVR